MGNKTVHEQHERLKKNKNKKEHDRMKDESRMENEMLAVCRVLGGGR